MTALSLALILLAFPQDETAPQAPQPGEGRLQAEEQELEEEVEELEEKGEIPFERASVTSVSFLYPATLYRPYFADPRQIKSGVKFMRPAGKGSGVKIENVIGVRRSILRWEHPDGEGPKAELMFEAGIFARFNISEHWDLDASDWHVGGMYVYQVDNLTAKFEFYHITSHMGDEYIFRTQEHRIGYHLNELVLGVSWDATEESRFYGEVGVAVYTGDDTDNGRFQVGYEWKGPVMVTDVTSPYFAVDLQTRKEIDWHVNKTVAVGICFCKEGWSRSFRIFVEYFHGHDRQTQFYTYQQRTIAAGLAFDL